jgi:cytochrome c oxidase subunit 1
VPLFVGHHWRPILAWFPTPVLAGALILLSFDLVVEHRFNPTGGRDPIVLPTYVWFYSHPSRLHYDFVPVFGMISDIIPVHSRKTILVTGRSHIPVLLFAFLGLIIWPTICSPAAHLLGCEYPFYVCQ